MVSQFTQPDNTAQDAGTYKGAIDDSISVMSRLAAAFAPHEQTVPDLTVRLDAGFVFASQTLTEVAAQSSATITAPSTNPRIDRIHVDGTTGAVGVSTGTEAASPSPPAIPTGKIPIARVSLSVGMAQITNADITDERVTQLGGSSGGLVLIESQNITSPVPTVDFTNGIDSTYETYLFEISGLTIDTDQRTLWLRFGTGVGPTWQNSNYGYGTQGTRAVGGGITANGVGQAQIVMTTGFTNDALGSAPGEHASGWLRVFNPATTTLHTHANWQISHSRANDGYTANNNGAGNWITTTPVTGIRLLLHDSGNFSGGRVTIYGINHQS